MSTDVGHRDKPRVLSKHVKVVFGKVDFDAVAVTMMANKNAVILKLLQGEIKRPVEGRSGGFTDQACKPTAVQFDDAGIQMSVQDIPPDAEKRLQSNQPNGRWVVVLAGMGQLELDHSGDNAPCVGVDLGGRLCQCSTGVPHGVALGAHRDAFALVVFVHCDCVREDFFGVSPELPQSKDDVVQVNDVMAFQSFVAATLQAHRTLIASNPVVVSLGCPDAFFQSLQ